MATICDGTCMICDGETKISTGKEQKQKERRVLLTPTWQGNTFFWMVIFLPWRGSVSAGSLLGDVLKMAQYRKFQNYELVKFKTQRTLS